MIISNEELIALNQPRFPGSEGEEQILKYIERYIEAEGGDHVFFSIPVDYHKPLNSDLYLNDEWFDAEPYVNFKPTENKLLKGKLYYISKIGSLDRTSCEGKIVLIDDPLSVPIVKKIESSGAIGVVTHNGLSLKDPLTDETIFHNSKRILNACSSKLAGVNISGTLARRLIEERPDEIAISNHWSHIPYICQNIVCELNGNNQNETIILCAHYDTVHDSPGAVDNLSGTLILLKIYSILKKKELSRSIRFCWFGFEEQQAECSARYTSDILNEENNKIILVVNVDSADAVMGCDRLHFLNRDIDVLKRLCIPKYGLREEDGEYGGDDLSFIRQGIPTVTFSKDSVISDVLHNTRWDTIENSEITDSSLNMQAQKILSLVSPLLFDIEKE